MAQESIVIRGAREHNLQNVDVDIPRDKLVVITGLSGSGKSSLAFDTIYAEGQRRYVESLSSYARQFLGQMDKPDLDSIDGLSPAVSIDQKTTSRNPRSTVGTVTEIYDYLRLLFARVGTPHCPECGRVIERQTTDQVADKVLAHAQGRRALVLAPVVFGRKGEYAKLFEDLKREGFSRVRVDGEVRELDEQIKLEKNIKHTIEVVVDRIVVRENSLGRIAEGVEQATKLAQGKVWFWLLPDRDDPEHMPGELLQYSLALACPEHGHSMDDLQPRDFSFNAPYGACPDCDGLGFRKIVDAEALIEDPSLSVAGGVFGSLFGNSNYWPQILTAACKHIGVSDQTPWKELPKKAQEILLGGLGETKIRVDYRTRDGRDTHWFTTFPGVRKVLFDKYQETTSETMRIHLEKFIREVPCDTCHGARLKPEILAVTVGEKSINEVCDLSCKQALAFFEALELSDRQRFIAGPVVKEVVARLRFLVNVGLDYLTLSRAAATLSGGEAQRIRLATQIGAGLMGVLYILDEPSIGLHQRDNDRLIDTLKRLRDQGNTVIVVEHDEDTIRAADYVIDMGPGAGELGGHVVAAGTPDQIACPDSITGAYLTGKKQIALPSKRRNPRRGAIKITGATANNLKSVNAKVELGTLTVVTGVSGSGKSSLVTDTLAPALTNAVHRSKRAVGPYKKLEGIDLIDKVIDIDQSPIGRTPRSNPATYIGLWDDLRALFASTPESRMRGYGPGRFSFNVPGGRCEACKGDGQIKIEMNFLPDVYVPCEVCHGKRYNRETLEVTYHGKTISDVLDMTVTEALTFFTNIPKIKNKLQTLHDVGLGYIHLGQPATTLSGGEAQRVKLAKELHRQQTGKTFYILDEPTTGLHFEDVRQLVEVLERLVDAGNTVLVIEHNLDVIKMADRILDMGPEGGDGGGTVVVYGTPEKVADCAQSYTGRFLAPILERDRARAVAAQKAGE